VVLGGQESIKPRQFDRQASVDLLEIAFALAALIVDRLGRYAGPELSDHPRPIASRNVEFASRQRFVAIQRSDATPSYVERHHDDGLKRKVVRAQSVAGHEQDMLARSRLLE